MIDSIKARDEDGDYINSVVVFMTVVVLNCIIIIDSTVYIHIRETKFKQMYVFLSLCMWPAVF